MREERLEVSVTFDERHGYIASAPELRTAVVALSLGGLRRRIEVALLPDDVRVVLQLDGLAERERHRRRAQALLAVAVLALALLHDPARTRAAAQAATTRPAPSAARRTRTAGRRCRSRRGRAAPSAGISPVRPA
jgi:hypothetical protein